MAQLETEELNGKMYPQGDSGTIEIIDIITTEEGTDAEIENIGTRSNAKLIIKIPRGNTGNGITNIKKTGSQGLVDTYTVYFDDGNTTTFTVTNANAQSAYTKVETDELLDVKIDKISIVNNITDTIDTGDDKKLASLASIKGFKISVGDLNNLTTTQKTSIVNAINELVIKISNLSEEKQNSAYYEGTINTNQITINSGTSAISGKSYKIHFPISTNVQIARLSVDNGQNYYNVGGYVPQALSDRYLEVVFTGTEFKVVTPISESSNQVVGDTLPIGSIFPFAGENIPENWLLCDGRAVSRTDYAQLYSVIGTTYGVGDDSTTFNLPNLNGRIPVGQDTTQTEFDTLGETGGEKNHTLTVAEMPSHNHGENADDNAIGKRQYQTSGNDLLQIANNAGYPIGSMVQRGGGQAHNNLQPYIVQKYIIKAKQTAGTVSQILNNYSESAIDAYSADYINRLHTYSTEETRIGTWIDGKPLYRKVVNTGQLPNQTDKNVPHGITNLDRVINLHGNAKDTNNNIMYHLPIINADNVIYQIALRCNATNIIIGAGIDRTNFNESYAIIEYTKTTD